MKSFEEASYQKNNITFFYNSSIEKRDYFLTIFKKLTALDVSLTPKSEFDKKYKYY